MAAQAIRVGMVLVAWGWAACRLVAAEPVAVPLKSHPAWRAAVPDAPVQRGAPGWATTGEPDEWPDALRPDAAEVVLPLDSNSMATVTELKAEPTDATPSFRDGLLREGAMFRDETLVAREREVRWEATTDRSVAQETARSPGETLRRPDDEARPHSAAFQFLREHREAVVVVSLLVLAVLALQSRGAAVRQVVHRVRRRQRIRKRMKIRLRSRHRTHSNAHSHSHPHMHSSAQRGSSSTPKPASGSVSRRQSRRSRPL